ncbi:hypothetical protein VTN31DRAFT_471 [Thermomyces dupontii]|uniref:uncharacterized protein n=1 Tax=Talaromyces thermophilus TaxID=28565 RepID=UPI00374318E9
MTETSAHEHSPPPTMPFASLKWTPRPRMTRPLAMNCTRRDAMALRISRACSRISFSLFRRMIVVQRVADLVGARLSP